MAKRSFSIGEGVACDLDRLVNTRLLVQANSGGGKSWALRRLLEQTHGRIQHLVIDPEGEFASLRERFDYVLAARQGGDTAADPRTAKLLAERLLELGVSAIIDISELKPHERIEFVKLFVDALVEAPKQLWHPALVVLDEAHIFAPEKGHGEAASADAVKSLATRGRKRGFCLVAATQRLSKLHKDVAAECNNKLIGRTGLDVDMKRASDELGFTTNDARLSLRALDPGEFYAFGPALTTLVTRARVGSVQTTHPKAGSKLAAVAPPPTDAVKALLPKLSDLPAEVEAREHTVAELRKKVSTLEREVREAKRAQPAAPAPPSEKVSDLKQQLARHRRALEEAVKIVVKVQAFDFPVESPEQRKELETAVARAVNSVLGPIEQRVNNLVGRVDGIKRSASSAEIAIKALLEERVDLGVQVHRREPFEVRPSSPAPSKSTPVVAEGMTGVGQRILNALAELETLGAKYPRRILVATLSGYTNVTSTGFVKGMGVLSSGGYIHYPDKGTVGLTDAGRAIASSNGAPLTSEELQARVMAIVGGKAAEVLQPLVRAYPKSLPRLEVANAASYTNVTSTGFVKVIGRLSSMGFIRYPSPGEIAAADILFLEADR